MAGAGTAEWMDWIGKPKVRLLLTFARLCSLLLPLLPFGSIQLTFCSLYLYLSSRR